MKAEIKNVFIQLLNAIQAGKIYAEDHPKYREFIDHLYGLLAGFLREKKEIVLGIVEGELAWENEIFFDLSRRLTSLIAFLEECGINRISFQAGLRADDLSRFVAFLTRPGKKRSLADHEEDDAQRIPNITIGRLRARIKDGEGKDKAGQLRSQYDGSLEFASRSLTSVLNKDELDFLDLRFHVLNIMENFMGRHQELLNLVSVKEKDLITFTHLLHVSVLAMFFGSRLGFAKEEVLDLGIAALFHDVGKLHISSKILKKDGRLADDEFLQMKDHPVYGSMILQDYREALGILPAVVAFEHHLRYDLKGYPKVAYPRPPHVASLIVSLCDVYDALAQKRSYKRDYPPEKIYDIMRLEKGKTFDPLLLDRFFQVLGVWPVGTMVELSDGCVGVVREINEQDIFRPKVDIVSPEGAKETVDIFEKKDALSIRKSLNSEKTSGAPFQKGPD